MIAWIYRWVNAVGGISNAWLIAKNNILNIVGDLKVYVLMYIQNMINDAIDLINGFISILNKIPGVSIDLIGNVTFGTTAQLENEAAKKARIAEIATAKAEAANKKVEQNTNIMSKFSGPGDIANVGKVGEVGKTKDDVNIADEDLKFVRDVAEMRYTQNLVTLTPQVVLSGVQISEKVDVDEVVRKIETKLEDEFVMAAEGVYN